jgi:hypothetical protein
MQIEFGLRFVLLLGVIVGSVAAGGAVHTAAAVECAPPAPIIASQAKPNAEATPVGQDDATPTSTRDLIREGLTNLVKVVAACKTDGDFATMSKLVTENYLGQVYGGGPNMSRETFLALADGLPTPRVRFRGFDDLSLTGPRAARANVKLIVGNQVTFERITFVEEKNRPGVWLIDSATPLRVRPPRNRADISITITKNRYNPAELSAANATVNIHASNSDPEGHELLVLHLADGMTTVTLLKHSGPDLPDGVTYMGQVTIPARSSGNLVLVGLKPGTYAIVDLLPADNGVPHLAVGMQATLTITWDND